MNENYCYDKRQVFDWIAQETNAATISNAAAEFGIGVAKYGQDGRLIAGFQVFGISEGAYTFGGVVKPNSLNRSDWAYCLNYLLETSKAKCVLAFTAQDNYKAVNMLGRLGFIKVGCIFNYYCDGVHADLWQLCFDTARALCYKLLRNKHRGADANRLT